VRSVYDTRRIILIMTFLLFIISSFFFNSILPLALNLLTYGFMTSVACAVGSSESVQHERV
jgi:hypothetical protein